MVIASPPPISPKDEEEWEEELDDGEEEGGGGGAFDAGLIGSEVTGVERMSADQIRAVWSAEQVAR